MQTILKGTHVALSETKSIRFYLSKRVEANLPCGFHESQTKTDPAYYTMLFRKDIDKSLLEKMNIHLTRLYDTYYFERSWERYSSRYMRCLGEGQSKELGPRISKRIEPLTLANIKGAMFITVFGWFACFLTLLIELMFWFAKNSVINLRR